MKSVMNIALHYPSQSTELLSSSESEDNLIIPSNEESINLLDQIKGVSGRGNVPEITNASVKFNHQ